MRLIVQTMLLLSLIHILMLTNNTKMQNWNFTHTHTHKHISLGNKPKMPYFILTEKSEAISE